MNDDILAEIDRPGGIIECTPQNVQLLVTEIRRQRARIADLKIENWQLRGALGYEVPGDIPCGDFKCGLCEAKAADIELKDKCIEELYGAIGEHKAEIARLKLLLDGDVDRLLRDVLARLQRQGAAKPE